MHYTLYLHCFHIFIFWYFDRMQTTIYRIVLRQFPLAFVFSLVWSVAALSFVCLFIQIPLDLLDERKQRKHSKWRQQAAYLSLPSSSSCSMLLLLWIGGFFFQFKVYNSLAICFATQPICTVVICYDAAAMLSLLLLRAQEIRCLFFVVSSKWLCYFNSIVVFAANAM